ncbi:MAG: hypothetical protein QNJ54_35415 [Prochloraceae cyanobacterium]|nr:hypothetical protein [Prochloraceae cyanobacterium]
MKKLFKETALELKGPAKRKFMALVVLELGDKGQRLAERELNWNRATIRKGMKELIDSDSSGDKHHEKGRTAIEKRLPNLLKDIKKIVDSEDKTVSLFQEERTYTNLSACEIREKLIEKFDYSSRELPTIQTIRTKLNSLGYHLARKKSN